MGERGPGPTPSRGPAAGPPGRWHEARLVAGVTIRDLVRRPGGWIATLLTALLFALLVGAVGVSGNRVQERADSRRFRVAVGGDLTDSAAVRQQLETARLLFVLSADPAGDVTAMRASAGIEFPEGTDRRIDAGEAVEVRLFARQSANDSVEALNTLVVRLQELELARLGGPAAVGAGGEVTVEELPLDPRINRIQLARQLAPITALLCIGVIAAVAAVLGTARERRSIEPLLVLPLARSSISAGIALGAFPLAALQLLAAVGLLVLTAAIPGSTRHQDAGTVVAMMLAGTGSALLLALVATGFGCLAGALGTGSDDALSLGDLVSVLFVVVGVIVFSAPTLSGTASYLVPVLGQVLVVRDTVGGTIDAVGSVLASIGAGTTFVVLVHLSGRCLADQNRVARAVR
jgi:ABC-type Na+ efflux pump permease subunit